MPFTLIKGRFKPKAGIPDGDSVRFLADDLSLWTRLEGNPVRLGTGVHTKDTAQLRFEGIDAIEKGAIKPLSTQAKDSMLSLIDFDGDTNAEPRGFILSRMTDDVAGRPICFAFAGETGLDDGSEVFLDAPMLRKSVNYKQMKTGFAYPLYYNTLFASLRREFNVALGEARNRRLGYWQTDATERGARVAGSADLTAIPPIWPKLWRRLEEYFRNHNSLSDFIAFLEEKNERVDVLSEMDERGLQDVVKVRGDKVNLTEPPENLRIRARAGGR
jgi:endonuclease YncB( thermonuclease family)